MKPLTHTLVLFAAALLSSYAFAEPPKPVEVAGILANPPETPVLCLHRGGVIAPDAPECSLRALRLAGEQGYSMVELDIRESKDQVPVIFHDNTMMADCGVEGRAEDYTVEELAKIHFNGTDQYIPSLEEALAVCKEFGMGLMLDIKTDGTDEYYKTIRALILTNGLERSTVCIARYPRAFTFLSEVSLMRMSKDETKRVLNGEPVDLTGKFWFDWPRYITNDEVKALHKSGALVFPSINIFHYEGIRSLSDDPGTEQAKKDIARMIEAGVIAYQIDSVYAEYF